LDPLSGGFNQVIEALGRGKTIRKKKRRDWDLGLRKTYVTRSGKHQGSSLLGPERQKGRGEVEGRGRVGVELLTGDLIHNFSLISQKKPPPNPKKKWERRGREPTKRGGGMEKKKNGNRRGDGEP